MKIRDSFLLKRGLGCIAAPVSDPVSRDEARLTRMRERPRPFVMIPSPPVRDPGSSEGGFEGTGAVFSEMKRIDYLQ
jgi:hypothetical protein